jgi:glucose-1-phosphate thymidylyltransferase
VRQLVEAGVDEIAIVVGDTEAQIRDAMGDGSEFGARITYVAQAAPAGIAHALGICREFAGGEPVVMCLGDNVLMGGLAGFVERFRASGAAGSVVLKAVEDARAFGVAVVNGEQLQRVIEKPTHPPSSLAVIGIYGFRREVFEVIAGLTPSARGELEIADAINGLIERGLTVEASVTDEYWIDTGKMEDMLAANRAVLDSRRDGPDSGIDVAAGAVVNGSRLIGPVCIARGALIENARVGPYVAVGPGCTIRGSAIENAIVMEQAAITDSPLIRDSMIGRFARVARAPTGACLTLGDHSSFEGPA